MVRYGGAREHCESSAAHRDTTWGGCVPSMVSCSGFGLHMHAQLLRLFVTPSSLSYDTVFFSARFRVGAACRAVTIDRGAKQT